jgi:hypothetical protein
LKILKLIFLFAIAGFISGCGDNPIPVKPVDEIVVEEAPKLPLFTLLNKEESGFFFLNEVQVSETVNVLAYENYFNGAGVGIGDINNDGLPDVFMTGNIFGGRLFLNKGNLKFEQISESANIFQRGFTTDVSFVDINGDGFQDIYLCRSLSKDPKMRSNVLLVNNQDNTFTDKSEEYGIADEGFSNQSIFFDFDNDNDLDLFVMNHRVDFANALTIYDINKNEGTVKKNDSMWRDFSADQLYRNDNGKFVNVTANSQMENNDFSLSAMATDINRDGLMDLYISNDFSSKDHAYINQGNGRFVDQIEQYFSHIPASAMGMDIGDINNDGHLDLINVDMTPEGSYRQKQMHSAKSFDSYHLGVSYGYHHQIERNMLQLNNGDGTYSEIGQLANVSQTDWSWSSLFADFDNDGWQDLFISNGHYKDLTDRDYIKYRSVEAVDAAGGLPNVKRLDLINLMTSTKISNYAFRNTGNLQFDNKAQEWGLSQASHSNGTAYADLDLDGDLDLIVNNFNEPSFLYRNNSEKISPKNFIQIKLKGPKMNQDGFGARVSVFTPGSEQVKECSPYRGFLSSVDPTLHFGLGDSKSIDSVIVHWPGGKSQTVVAVESNERIVLDFDDAIKVTARKEKTEFLVSPIKKAPLQWTHKENLYLDFKQEPLMEHFQSNKGPFTATADVNKDGLLDMFVTGSTGSPGVLFLQNKNGSFLKKSNNAFVMDSKFEDGGCAFFDLNGDGFEDLYVSSGSNETPDSNLFQDRIYLNDGKGHFTKQEQLILNTPTSCVAPFDFDLDGDMDLFVGGFVHYNAYPTAGKSYLLENKNGQLENRPDLLPKGGDFGIINSAVALSESQLVIAGEWTEIMVLQASKTGPLALKSTGLDKSKGWWNTLETGDFDNDGDLDLIAGNRGTNTAYKPVSNGPAKIFYGQFNSDKDLDAFTTYYFAKNAAHLPKYSLDEMFLQMKNVRKIFENYEAYSRASLADIIPNQSQVREANTFESVFIENLGDGNFKMNPLPNEAQFSYAHGALCTDINSDGNLDVLLVGNNFSVDVDQGSADASFGTVLIGDGKNNFSSLSSTVSGFNTERHDTRKIIELNGGRIAVFTNDGPILFYKKSDLD